MGLLNKILGISSSLLTIALVVCYTSLQLKNKQVTKLRNFLKEEKSLVDSLKESIILENKKTKGDSLNYVNIIRETQSVLVQVNNKNKSLERENNVLRKGIRLDLLTIRQRRNGKSIDSTYTIGYKFLEK